MYWYTRNMSKHIQMIVSYHSSQDGDYAYNSPDDYSDSNDSYQSSFIDDSELNDDASYFDDQDDIYTKYSYIIFIQNKQDILMMATYQRQKRNYFRSNTI